MTRRSFGIPLLAVAILTSGGATAEGPPMTASEYQVKAAFLYNFAKFVEWPHTQDEQKQPFAICVLGKDPFGPALDQVMEGRTVDGRRIVTRRTDDIAVARSCQILFVSPSEVGRLDETVSALQEASVLSVSEIKSFSRRGGVIAFVAEGQRVRFHINAAAAVRANLKISSKLLELAVPENH